MRKLIWNSFAIFGILLFLSLLIFFSQNTKIKIRLVKNFVFKTIGYGKDYNGFVANSFSDIKNIIIRGTKWRISGKNYTKLSLEIPFEDLSILNSQRLGKINNDYRARGELFLNDNKKKIKFKIRSKGARHLHKDSFDDMSFKIDIRGDDRIFGLEEFSIQKPIIRNYGWELLITNITASKNIISPKIIPIDLFLNGKKKGIYFIEESFTNETLESSYRKSGPIYSITSSHKK